MRLGSVLGAALTLCALIAFATELDIDQDVHGAAIDSEQKQHLQVVVGEGSKPEPLHPVAYLAELVEQQKRCPKHKLACPASNAVTATRPAAQHRLGRSCRAVR